MVKEQICAQTQEVSPGAFQVKVVCTADEFNSLGPQWDALVCRAKVDHPFLSHTWLSTWWEAFGQGSELFVVTVRDHAELIAAAAMQRMRINLCGVPVDAITSIHNPHTPRFDFILAAGTREKDSYELIWKKLLEAVPDVVILKQVPVQSRTLTSIQRLARHDHWTVGWWPARPSPYIPLGCSHSEVLARIKGGQRYNLRKRYERLTKVGPVDVEVITDKAALHDAMNDGLRIEAAAWKGDQGTAILSDPNVTAFYTRLAEREAERGNLRLYFLRVGGKRISFSYILRNDQTLYGVKIGYDPEYHAYSPGNMLLNLVLQEACANGCKEYDFLGADDEWKFDWTKESRAHQWMFLFADRVRPRLLHRLKFSLIPRVKQCISRYRPASIRRTS